jgi:hypothetical protein
LIEPCFKKNTLASADEPVKALAIAAEAVT